MITFLLIILYVIFCTFFLAKKDAESYRLKSSVTSPLVLKIIKRWHADGVVLAVLINTPLFFDHAKLWWQIIIINILIRLSEFDLTFNYYALLPTTELGSTASVDIFFSKIFGKQGALKKSITFFVLLCIFVLLKLYFKF